ncbi:MAG: ROK family protein [Chloroflexi bacterium]|nr:ROK family protein [Chloroflexota bacterium]MCI0581098.1 ROK family protein [Chloroflexota bacterium]MCI0649847.1 ROK family protein [Chloroflexota bacterium]MCI0731344.1 ROK family protein [Chloroflexota bacterium]
MSDAARLWLGIDVGGTKVEALLADQRHEARGRAVQETDSASPERVVASIDRAARQALGQAGATLEQVAAVGVGAPGHVDPATGVVRLAVNLNIHEFPLGEALAAAFRRPVFLDNDVRMATVGGYWRLKQRQALNNMLFVSIGTGIAAGLILNGRLYRGERGVAGEVGHMVVEANGRRCQCGNWGCLEAMAAGPAIAEQARTAVARGEESALVALGEGVTAQDVYQAAQAGDRLALAVADRAGHYLGRALQNLVMTLDVSKILLGGGVSRAGQAFLQPILREWENQRRHSVLAEAMLNPAILELVPPDYPAGPWGAVIVAQQRLEDSW